MANTKSMTISGWRDSEGQSISLEVTENSVNHVTNSSVVHWKLSVNQVGGSAYQRTSATAIINGVTVYSADKGASTKEFPATRTGSVEGDMTIAHNSSGAKTIDIHLEGFVYVTTVREANDTLTLTQTDRSAPSVTISSVKNIGSDRFTVDLSSNATCDLWQLSYNGTNWGTLSDVSGTSCSVVVSGLEPGKSYAFVTRARKKLNGLYGYSAWNSVTTLGASTIGNVNPFNLEDAITVPVTKLSSQSVDKLELIVGGITIKTINPYTTSTFRLTNAELLNAYSYVGQSSSCKIRVTTYMNGSAVGTNEKTVPCYRGGTMKTKATDYKRATPYVNIGGTWHPCIGYAKNGSWMRGK